MPAGRVLTEEESATTEQNLRFSVAVLARHGRGGRAVVVTNNYHVFRTAVIARRLGLDLAVGGAPTAAVAVLALVPWVTAFG